MLENTIKISPEAEQNSKEIIEVNRGTVNYLQQQANNSPRGRYRICLHRSNDHPVNEMVIIGNQATYFRPHRHPKGRDESYYIIEGSMVVFIFDEVSTGFRPSAGGVQPVYGVEPDMAVFAKSISNGYPMGAVVGKRSVMEPASQMFVSSTYWSDTIGLRAALTSLQEVASRGVPDYLQDFGSQLQNQLNEIAADVGLAVQCTGIAWHPHLNFSEPAARIASTTSSACSG